MHVNNFLCSSVRQDVLEPLMHDCQDRRHVITGDFNINVLRRDNVYDSYVRMYEFYGYKVINTHVTRPASSSLIDHFVCNFDINS